VACAQLGRGEGAGRRGGSRGIIYVPVLYSDLIHVSQELFFLGRWTGEVGILEERSLGVVSTGCQNGQN
jgi:hypothetical protein